ncbi:MAG: RluA family pseudouridine synthase [Clostridia bacterium]|nr:RluA family pseudouridine synthase [Clostridia bacterium]
MKVFTSNQNKKLSKVVFNFVDDLSYAEFRKALRNKDVKVNGKRVSCDVDVLVGDTIEIYYKPTQKESYSVIFEDQNILVINKKSGYTSESVFEDLSKKYSGVGFIHRLDRNTSGLMIFSLNATAEKELLDGFKNHTFIKEYLAEVVGVPRERQAFLEGYLLKDKNASTVKIYDKQVKGSVYIKTGYKVVKTSQKTSTLQVRLYTGKTHQIRAHLSYIGHPIVGDGKYGDNEINRKLGKKEQQLISFRLTLFFSKDQALFYLNQKQFEIKE